jgi:hypothetical protein
MVTLGRRAEKSAMVFVLHSIFWHIDAYAFSCRKGTHGFEAFMSSTPSTAGSRPSSQKKQHMMDGVVIFACVAVLMGFFAHQCINAFERTERLQALYNELEVKSPFHKSFIGEYRLCAPGLPGSHKVGPDGDCLGQVVSLMKPLSPSVERLFEVEQDIRIKEQTIYAQTTTIFLK